MCLFYNVSHFTYNSYEGQVLDVFPPAGHMYKTQPTENLWISTIQVKEETRMQEGYLVTLVFISPFA